MDILKYRLCYQEPIFLNLLFESLHNFDNIKQEEMTLEEILTQFYFHNLKLWLIIVNFPLRFLFT